MRDTRRNGWVMVTGATGGLGGAVVARLVADGRSVVAAAREPGRLAPTPGSGRVVGVELDAERPSTLEAALRETRALVGDHGLAGLVNMAGIIVEGPLEAVAPEELRRQLEINVIAPFALTQAMLPLLQRARGRIVNIGAISARLTPPFYGPVAASKAALAALTDAMRLEFAQFGIDVALIEPGAMRTGIFATSRAARDAALSALPDLERRYRPALHRMDRAFEKAGADDPEVVAKAVMRALFRKRPEPRVVVGKGTGALLALSRLPIRTRDRLLTNALGLSEQLRRQA